jgi:hypothetical protein
MAGDGIRCIPGALGPVRVDVVAVTAHVYSIAGGDDAEALAAFAEKS